MAFCSLSNSLGFCRDGFSVGVQNRLVKFLPELLRAGVANVVIFLVYFARRHGHKNGFAALDNLDPANDEAVIQANGRCRKQGAGVLRQIDFGINFHEIHSFHKAPFSC